MTEGITAQTITIQKGKGITHALLDVVKNQNMEISDGKITAKEWNATLDKLAEIQQKRKAENKASIFSGGTNKTEHRGNFVVHPNQKIEFTEAEMKELYESMGVSFKTQSAKNSEEIAKLAADKGYRATYNAEIFYNQAENQHYKWNKDTEEFEKFRASYVYEDGSYFIKEKDGSNICRTYYSKDGVKEKEKKYYENGNKLFEKFYDENEREYYVCYYREDGTKGLEIFKDNNNDYYSINYEKDGKTVRKYEKSEKNICVEITKAEFEEKTKGLKKPKNQKIKTNTGNTERY